MGLRPPPCAGAAPRQRPPLHLATLAPGSRHYACVCFPQNPQAIQFTESTILTPDRLHAYLGRTLTGRVHPRFGVGIVWRGIQASGG